MTTVAAKAAGVSRLLTVGIDLPSSARARDLAAADPGVFHSAGLHPNSAARLPDEWPGLEELAQEPACVAIGETGLDYYRDTAAPEQQKASLRAHLQLASDLRMPVIIHTRDAFQDIFGELAAFPEVRGVLHCFSGGIDEARRALELDYHLSFAGPITYPRNSALRAAAAYAPADRILVETDAPYLPPQQWRGQENRPAYIVETIKQLAAERQITFEDAAQITTANGRRLFGV